MQAYYFCLKNKQVLTLKSQVTENNLFNTNAKAVLSTFLYHEDAKAQRKNKIPLRLPAFAVKYQINHNTYHL